MIQGFFIHQVRYNLKRVVFINFLCAVFSRSHFCFNRGIFAQGALVENCFSGRVKK